MATEEFALNLHNITYIYITYSRKNDDSKTIMQYFAAIRKRVQVARG